MGYGNLLITLDGSELAERALESACRAANPGAKLHLLSVVGEAVTANTSLVSAINATFAVQYMRPAPFHENDFPDEYVQRVSYIEAVRDRLLEQGYDVSTEITFDPVVETILNCSHDVELVVMATHGRTGLRKLVLGSVTEAVLHNVACPLLIVPAGGDWHASHSGAGYNCILVSLDGSPESATILPEVEKLVLNHPAKVVLLRTIPHGAFNPARHSHDEHTQLNDSTEREIREYLDEIALRFERIGAVPIIETNFNKPGDEIQLAAEHYQADLIAMSTHGRTGLNKLLYASVTEFVLHHAHCPVLVTRMPHA